MMLGVPGPLQGGCAGFFCFLAEDVKNDAEGNPR